MPARARLRFVHAIFLGAALAETGVVELDGASFDSVVNASECCAALVHFYAPWDSYSAALAPELALAVFDCQRRCATGGLNGGRCAHGSQQSQVLLGHIGYARCAQLPKISLRPSGF